MANRFPPIPQFVTALPDESCYSILCRCAVHAAMSTNKFCTLMFGRQRNLYNFLWQPFKPDDMHRWFDNVHERISSYVQQHSCIPYRYPFVEKSCQDNLHDWNEGEFLSNGCYKSITRMLGYRLWRKEHLLFCPECAKEDRLQYGETYWHMIPQLPGVMVCPVHLIPLEKSVLTLKNTRYDLLPAEYWIAETKIRTEKVSYNDICIADNSKWLMENGWLLDSSPINRKLNNDFSVAQYDKVEATLSRFTRQNNPKSESLYRVLMAVEKNISLAEIADDLIILF